MPRNIAARSRASSHSMVASVRNRSERSKEEQISRKYSFDRPSSRSLCQAAGMKEIDVRSADGRRAAVTAGRPSSGQIRRFGFNSSEASSTNTDQWCPSSHIISHQALTGMPPFGRDGTAQAVDQAEI